jgi:hypothetical protein
MRKKSKQLFTRPNLLSKDQVVLKNVQAAHHLTKYEYPVSVCFQFRQQLVHQDHFTRRLNQCFVISIRVLALTLFEFKLNLVLGTYKEEKLAPLLKQNLR